MSPEATRILVRLGLACWYCRAQARELVRPARSDAVPFEELRVCGDRPNCLGRIKRREREGTTCAA